MAVSREGNRLLGACQGCPNRMVKFGSLSVVHVPLPNDRRSSARVPSLKSGSHLMVQWSTGNAGHCLPVELSVMVWWNEDRAPTEFTIRATAPVVLIARRERGSPFIPLRLTENT